MPFSLLQPLCEIPLAFVDTETTGASADFGHRVIELGIVRVEGGARVSVRSTLNVGALDLMGCARIRLQEPQRGMARRMMEAYRKLGCEQSWTCAPYQAGHRPALGSDVAWGESNAVVFCNSVLGARTNRLGMLQEWPFTSI